MKSTAWTRCRRRGTSPRTRRSAPTPACKRSPRARSSGSTRWRAAKNPKSWSFRPIRLPTMWGGPGEAGGGAVQLSTRYAVLTLDASVPRHIGIIMDGNGRWARRQGHPASFGHRAGVRAIKRVLDGCEQLGVHALSVYAFSTENWSRPRAEVRALMRLFHETMQREIGEMHRRGVRIVVSGRRDGLSQRMRDPIEEAVAADRGYKEWCLHVVLEYRRRARPCEPRGRRSEG